MHTLNNIQMVRDTAISPDPIYAKRPLEWYVGRCVKIGLQSREDNVEYMWVKVTGIESPNLFGLLDNEPLHCTHLSLGDRVVLSRLHIVAVDLTDDEWWDEVFMLRAKGDFFNRHLGIPCPESGFANFYDAKLTPRQALNCWVKWQPHEDEPLQFLLDIAADRADDLK